MSLCYTVGIKRRFLPGYRKYRVYSHSWDTQKLEVVLVLELDDGGFVSVGMTRKEMKVFPDYHDAKREQAKIDEKRQPEIDEEAIRAEIRREVEEQVLSELQKLKAPQGEPRHADVRS